VTRPEQPIVAVHTDAEANEAVQISDAETEMVETTEAENNKPKRGISWTRALAYGVLPAVAQQAVARFLTGLDRALPGRIEGFYVVGSASFGAFRPGRSDLDFVAVLARELDQAALDELRRWQRGSCAAAVLRSAARIPPQWPLICNGIYVRWGDLSRSPLDVVPIASHVAEHFRVGSGFDANPVTWRTLAERGMPVRGPDPRQLGVHDDRAELRRWTLGNLDGYWRWWSGAARGHDRTAAMALLRRFAAWGVLGAPRLHYTLHTGEITTKEQAAHHALEVFSRRWHPLIEEALAFWRGSPASDPYRDPFRRRRDAAGFVASIVDHVTGR